MALWPAEIQIVGTNGVGAATAQCRGDVRMAREIPVRVELRPGDPALADQRQGLSGGTRLQHDSDEAARKRAQIAYTVAGSSPARHASSRWQSCGRAR